MHGTTTEYVKNKCRCDECKAAWSAYQAKRRAPKEADWQQPGTPAPELDPTEKETKFLPWLDSRIPQLHAFGKDTSKPLGDPGRLKNAPFRGVIARQVAEHEYHAAKGD